MFLHSLVIHLLALFLTVQQPVSQLFEIKQGKIHFRSNAPLELIEADSDDLKGLVDFEKQTFAFSVAVSTFEGFNSALQREHFNENYMESDKYAKATFSGRIIEKIDITSVGNFSIRAKGKLNIHGVEQERIIKADLSVQAKKIIIHAVFTVPLKDHNISIPKVVHQKIAEEINVTIDAVAEAK